MAMSTSTGDDAAPYINITPLIDILLVLLIIFMVISPLKPTRFEAKVPAEPDPNDQTIAKPNPNTLLVEVTKDQKVLLNREEMGSFTDPSQLGTTHLGKPRADQNDRTFGIDGAERSHESW